MLQNFRKFRIRNPHKRIKRQGIVHVEAKRQNKIWNYTTLHLYPDGHLKPLIYWRRINDIFRILKTMLRNRYNTEKYYARIVHYSKYYSNFVLQIFQQILNNYENISLHQPCA